MSETEEKQNFLKHAIKDIIFQNAFAAQENLPEIYKALHPEDPNVYSPDDFIITNLNTVLTNGIRNDLSFWNLKTNIMSFLEAESSWKIVELRRFRKYVLEVTTDTIRKYDNSDIVDILGNEIYILSTGGNERHQITYRMFDGINKEFNDGSDFGNFEVTVLSRKNKNIPANTIIEDYFRFCEYQTKIVKIFGRNRKAAVILIENCIENNIFAPYFKKHKEEVMENVESLFSQERELERFVRENSETSYNNGFDNGIKEHAKTVFEKLVARGFSEDEAHSIAYDESISKE